MKTIEQITTKDFYYCYDMHLSNYLKSKGIPYFLKARSIKDKSIYTMYLYDDRVRESIAEFNQMKCE